jgi:hypothetical protein
MHERGTTTVRKDTYKGHAIEIRTTYEITIDGTPVLGHLEVANNGNVHYHPVPNYSSESAIDLLRHVIDTFPDEFAKPARKRTGSKSTSGRAGGAAHGGHHR